MALSNMRPMYWSFPRHLFMGTARIKENEGTAEDKPVTAWARDKRVPWPIAFVRAEAVIPARLIVRTYNVKRDIHVKCKHNYMSENVDS